MIHGASWHSNTTRKQTDSFFDSQLFSNRLKTVVGAASVGIAMRAMLSQRLECHALVMQHEARRGQPFRAYASIRSDLFFFQRLPTTLLHRVQRPAIASAVVPSGDDWGANTSVNDKVLSLGHDLRHKGPRGPTAENRGARVRSLRRRMRDFYLLTRVSDSICMFEMLTA